VLCMSVNSQSYGMQVSMSSTSIVIKCLADARQSASLHGQITIGTLILQVLEWAAGVVTASKAILYAHTDNM
jgi:predicted Kef-type K+ transport protein